MPNIGKDVRTLKGATGKAYGKNFFAAGQKPEGQINDVGYMFARPGDPKPLAKVSFATNVVLPRRRLLLWLQAVTPAATAAPFAWCGWFPPPNLSLQPLPTDRLGFQYP
jgi:hypothetical protein